MQLQSTEKIVKQGTFLYGGSVECDIRVVYSPVRYGSGDYEDPENIREDQEIDSYYLQFGSTSERGRFNAGGGCYPTLSDAMEGAASASGIGPVIKWLPE